MAVWLVRSGKTGENEAFALDNGQACIGWDEVPDLRNFVSKEGLRSTLEELMPDWSKAAISNSLGQLWGFKERIQLGDLIALPLKTRSGIAIGRVVGEYEKREDNPEGALHIRPVQWLETSIPRAKFGQDILYSLGAFMTVCQVQRNDAEQRILSILDGQPDPYFGQAFAEEEELTGDTSNKTVVLHDLEQYAMDAIAKCITAKFSGHSLAKLVGDILEAQGFTTDISPKGPDGGVDILAGTGEMGFDPPRLCVQVKSGGPVDVTVLRELQGVMRNYGAQQGLLVSWGGFKNSVYSEAKTLFFHIRLWDETALMKALLAKYHQLPEQTQAELPLKRIWTLVPDDLS